jgi:hypothetical protein
MVNKLVISSQRQKRETVKREREKRNEDDGQRTRKSTGQCLQPGVIMAIQVIN